jgi:hypothetical protein
VEVKSGVEKIQKRKPHGPAWQYQCRRPAFSYCRAGRHCASRRERAGLNLVGRPDRVRLPKLPPASPFSGSLSPRRADRPTLPGRAPTPGCLRSTTKPPPPLVGAEAGIEPSHARRLLPPVPWRRHYRVPAVYPTGAASPGRCSVGRAREPLVSTAAPENPGAALHQVAAVPRSRTAAGAPAPSTGAELARPERRPAWAPWPACPLRPQAARPTKHAHSPPSPGVGPSIGGRPTRFHVGLHPVAARLSSQILNSVFNSKTD